MGRTRRRRKGGQARRQAATLAVVLVAAGGIHLGVAPDHGRRAAAAGAFFVVAAAAQLVLAGVVAARPRRSALGAVVALNALLIVVWGVSRLAQMPLSGHNAPEPVTIVDGVAVLLEAAAIAAAVLLLRAPLLLGRPSRARPPRHAFSPALALVLVAVLGVTAPAAGALTASSDDRAGHHSPADAPHARSEPDGAHAEGAEDLLRTLISAFERDGVCGPSEPSTTEDCRADAR